MPDIMLSSSHIIPHSCIVGKYYHSPCLQVTALKYREVASLGSELRSSNTGVNPVQSDSKYPHFTMMQCCSRQFLILGNPQNLLQRLFFSKTSSQDSYQRVPIRQSRELKMFSRTVGTGHNLWLIMELKLIFEWLLSLSKESSWFWCRELTPGMSPCLLSYTGPNWVKLCRKTLLSCWRMMLHCLL